MTEPLITPADVLSKVVAWLDEHDGSWPARAFVNDATAESLSGSLFFVSPDSLKFGQNTLGVAEWYIDHQLPDGALRLE